MLRARPDAAGLFVDFDGTLSDIAPTPEAATAVSGAGPALEALARRLAMVAVVSGRPAAQVRDKLGVPAGVRWFGLYGLDEGRGETGDVSDPLLPLVAAVVEDVAGTRLEPKGATVAVHYRDADDPDGTRAILLERLGAVADDAAMKLIEGKRVVELAPGHAPTKGDVLRRHGRGLEVVCYAGDDLADVHAYAAVDELAAAGATGIKIAVRSAETPPELLAAADVSIDGPSAMVQLLRSVGE